MPLCSSSNSILRRRIPLANDRSIDRHDNSLAYVEVQAPSPVEGQFKADWAIDHRSVTLSGPCPACGGRTVTKFSVGIGGAKGSRAADRRLGLPSTLTLYCECGHAHQDRPPDALDRGCGRYWSIAPPNEGGERPTHRAANQKPPDETDVPELPSGR